MAGKKQLIVVCEGTAALAGPWNTIFSDYLHKLIRSFCGDDANPDVQLALVKFNVHSINSPYLVQRGGWETSLDHFLNKLAAMDFSAGVVRDVAVAEGLSEALKICPPPKDGQTTQNDDPFRRHCILVAASNPYPLPTAVYRPPDNSQNPFCDVETLVKSFPQCRVSLSVICPTQLPKLKSIYNLGKRNPRATDYTINIVTNPHYLVLISEDLKSALVDVNQLGITTLPSNHSPSNTVSASVSGMSSTSSSLGWKSVPAQPYHHAPASDSSMTLMPESATSSGVAHSAMNTARELLASDITDIPWGSICNLSKQLELEELVKKRQFAQSGTSPNKRMKVTVQSDMPAASALQSSHSGYVKLWEGLLFGQQRNLNVFLTRLQAYRKWTDSPLLAKDWPSTMQFDKAMTQEDVNIKEGEVGNLDRLAFVAMNQHEYLKLLQEENVCAVIQLPSQLLVLSVSIPETTWIGTLFPKDAFNAELEAYEQQSSVSAATAEG